MWTPEEDEKIRAAAEENRRPGGYTAEGDWPRREYAQRLAKVAARIGRTLAAVRKRAQRIGARSKKPHVSRNDAMRAGQRSGAMTELQLQEAVMRLALRRDWLLFHVHYSFRSHHGFPDLVLVRGKRVLWRELKPASGSPTPAQREWLDRLTAAGQDADIWRPGDWISGRVERELR